MGKNRTVLPSVTRVPISDGDWVELKDELNVGEQKRLEAAGLKAPIIADGRIYSPIDWEVHDQLRALIWVTDWSLKGPDDKDLKLNMASVQALNVETFEEINKAIIEHVRVQAEAKKARRAATTEEKLTKTPAETPSDRT